MAKLGGIRDYNRIRKVLQHIYLYGVFSREDFEDAGILNKKDYDFGISLLKAIYPSIDNNASRTDGKKVLRFQRNYAEGIGRMLSDSYLLHAFDSLTDLPEVLLILSFMALNSRSVNETCNMLESFLIKNTVTYSTVNRRIDELCAYGYIQKEKRQFCLRKNPFSKLGESQLVQIYDYIRFVECTCYPRIPGRFLRNSLERHMLRRGLDIAEYNNPFLTKHNVYHCVLEENTVLDLLEAISEKCFVTIQLFGADRDNSDICLFPVSLRIDTYLGRWYLIASKDNEPFICRISNIKSVSVIHKSIPDYQHIFEEIRSAYKHTGCSGRLPENRVSKTVEAILRFDGLPGLFNQFKRELRFGFIVEDGANLVYRAVINDPEELVPFLRAYSPWIKVLPGEHDIPQRIHNDLLMMKKQLESEI